MNIKIKGELINFDEPKVMGILNLTPNSFYDGGKFNTVENALKKTDQMIKEGAFFIDIGSCSTKPGVKIISENEEKKRLLPVLENLIKVFPDNYFSIDTFRSKIASEALEMGASMINDISGGKFDHNMMETVAKYDVPYVLMHGVNSIEKLHLQPRYENLIQEVLFFFSKKIQEAYKFGINDVIIDPGFGFGKTLQENYVLLKDLKYFKNLDLPILIGLSRKSMIHRVLNLKADNALNGSTVLHTYALLKGVDILRVHDVMEAKECIKLTQTLI